MADTVQDTIYVLVKDEIDVWYDIDNWNNDQARACNRHYSHNIYSVIPCKAGTEYYSDLYSSGLHVTLLISRNYNQLTLNKVVLVGYFCDEAPLAYDKAAWDAYMDIINCVEFTSYGSYFAIDIPTFDEGCVGDYPAYWPSFSSGYTIELWDLDKNNEIVSEWTWQ